PSPSGSPDYSPTSHDAGAPIAGVFLLEKIKRGPGLGKWSPTNMPQPLGGAGPGRAESGNVEALFFLRRDERGQVDRPSAGVVQLYRARHAHAAVHLLALCEDQ